MLLVGAVSESVEVVGKPTFKVRGPQAARAAAIELLRNKGFLPIDQEPSDEDFKRAWRSYGDQISDEVAPND